MRAIDNDMLVRLVTRGDAKHVAAAEVFIAPGTWVSQLVLAKAMWAFASVYQLEPSAIATAVEMFLNHRDLSVQDPGVVMAALEHFRKRPKIGFSDRLVLEAARKAGHTPLVTFNRELNKLDDTQRL